MTEDKRKKIITGCIIAGMVVLIIVLTTVILKVKKTKVGTADKTDPAEYSSSDITSKETESVTVPQEQPTEYSSSDITSKETESITVPQEQPTTPAGNDKITNTVNYSVILKKNNSWSDGTNEFFQYECIVTNNTGYDITSWKFEGNIGNVASIESSWNGNFAYKDGMLVITPLDWNGNIKAGQTVSTCGVIIKGSNLKESVEYGSSCNNNYNNNYKQ